MSNKGTVAHQVLDRLRGFEVGWNTKMQELVTRHNDLSAKMAAIESVVNNVASFMAAEMGKQHGQVQGQFNSVGRSLDTVDLNIIALSEVVKELVGQLTQIDFIFRKLRDSGSKFSLDLTEEELSQIKEDAEAWNKELLTSAFKSAQSIIKEQNDKAKAAAVAQEMAAKEAADAATTAAAEAETVGRELRDAESVERSLTATASGGQGSQYPDGAEIFGG